MNKLLTIAIPTYNRINHIGMALESILSQYDDRVEVLISDNCSNDGTEDFIQKNYPNVVYSRNEQNVGADLNFIKCYEKAQGKYVMLLGDDDVLIDGSLQLILNYLEENADLKLLFLNHNSFSIDQDGKVEQSVPFLEKDIGNKCTRDKEEFIRIAKYQLTFMSSFIISKPTIDEQIALKYGNTSFIHTCIAFENIKEENALLGIIGTPCVSQNITENKNNRNMRFIFETFGPKEKYVLCDVGSECGFSIKRMKAIHSSFICSSWPRTIMSFKAQGVKEWKEAFWTYGFPSIKEYKRAWFTVIPIVLLPDFIAKQLRMVKRSLRG